MHGTVHKLWSEWSAAKAEECGSHHGDHGTGTVTVAQSASTVTGMHGVNPRIVTTVKLRSLVF